MNISTQLAFVTDDNDINLKVANALLNRLGWTVETFDNAPAMLARLEDVQPAAILLDISMPNMGGETACALIRARPEWQGIRIIAYTAHAMSEDAERFLSGGFDATLIKPITFASLTQAIGSPERG
ncbi:response regulator [Thauera sp. SDU_THAU2]|uniref:response regulator n=1 Tax=Thauera sp. SDU_THAU2 TaxID=3136633 RepID=UPI00311E9D5E